jgi:hypothetical protein
MRFNIEAKVQPNQKIELQLIKHTGTEATKLSIEPIEVVMVI